jgi:flavin-binding protein dodecin
MWRALARGCTLTGSGQALQARPGLARTNPERSNAHDQELTMSDHVYKLVELVGSSTVSTDDAIRNAIETAGKTLRHIDWFQTIETRGHVTDGKVAHFQVTLKVGFRLEG